MPSYQHEWLIDPCPLSKPGEPHAHTASVQVEVVKNPDATGHSQTRGVPVLCNIFDKLFISTITVEAEDGYEIVRIGSLDPTFRVMARNVDGH